MNNHFVELRSRIISCSIFFSLVFLSLFFFRNNLYTIVASPILKFLPANSSLVATNITSTFLIPLRLSFILAIYISIPYIFYQAWRFIAPGLYAKEKRIFMLVVIGSIGLFLLGNIFAFYIIIPISLNFFITTAPDSIKLMIDINQYLDFIVTIVMVTGTAFQIPIVIKLLVSLGIMDVNSVKNKRSLIVVISFVLGMLLTPPDVISQIVLAIPIWALFELGILISSDKLAYN